MPVTYIMDLTLMPHRRLLRHVMLVTSCCVLVVSSAHAQQPRPTPQPLDSMPWRPSGPGLEIAIIDGDPSVAGQPYTMMLRLADGAWIPPHTHNVPKRLLVVSGTLLVGHGEALDSAHAEPLMAGSFLLMPADHAHYEGGRGRTVVALYGIGPLRTVFVKPTP
jgi:quercetin dioxygenase-like cupin family protein